MGRWHIVETGSILGLCRKLLDAVTPARPLTYRLELPSQCRCDPCEQIFLGRG
jgi:hypothetical protein